MGTADNADAIQRDDGEHKARTFTEEQKQAIAEWCDSVHAARQEYAIERVFQLADERGI